MKNWGWKYWMNLPCISLIQRVCLIVHSSVVLDLQLRAISKSSLGANLPHKMHAIHDVQSLKSNPKPINHWIKMIEDLHESNPSEKVQYSQRMPDIEALMQAWDPDFEKMLGQVSFLNDPPDRTF
jgi:hypothetical protein